MGMKQFWGTRYQSKKQPVFSLKEYIARTQILGRPEDKEKCEQTIDYLYSIIPNDEEHALQYLQIQKMDMREADQIPVKGEWVSYIPRFTGAAKEAAERFEESSTKHRIIGLFQNYLFKPIHELSTILDVSF